MRSQTQLTLPVVIRNTGLYADLSLQNVPSTPVVNSTYAVVVTANTNTVSRIRLFSTGGELASLLNQPTARFLVDGTILGAGSHPFYALVETADGLKFRTAKRFLRLVNNP